MSLRLIAVLLLGFIVSASPQERAPAPCEVLVPVLDSKQSVVTANTPGGQSYPVFRTPPDTTLVKQVRRELAESFAQQVLKLDRYARNHQLVPQGTHAGEARTAPMYLLMSREEGGFPRSGFWFEDAKGARKLVLAGYVDLVVTENSVKVGDFEEIFSHELGHLILTALTGGISQGASHKMHESMSVTDYPTAFDEGFAEHFQPLVRDATTNSFLRKMTSGTNPTDFELFWLSAADGQLRTDGPKNNLFIHRKPLPSMALDVKPDLYRLFIEEETSTAYLPTELKSGQEMMASEGVVATLFYRIVNDPQLRAAYREPAFYRRFLQQTVDVPNEMITPYENVNLKLFAAIERLGGATVSKPPMINLVEQYAKLFPDEAKRVYQIFIETTWGATASRTVASALQTASRDGRRGDTSAFRENRPFPLLDSLIADVATGKQALDANLGPELWIVNSAFKIARPVWSTERATTLTINVNTASIAEFMTLPGVDLALARRILATRDAHGFFRSIDELSDAGVPADVIRRLREMEVPSQR